VGIPMSAPRDYRFRAASRKTYIDGIRRGPYLPAGTEVDILWSRLRGGSAVEWKKARETSLRRFPGGN